MIPIPSGLTGMTSYLWPASLRKVPWNEFFLPTNRRLKDARAFTSSHRSCWKHFSDTISIPSPLGEVTLGTSKMSCRVLLLAYHEPVLQWIWNCKTCWAIEKSTFCCIASSTSLRSSFRTRNQKKTFWEVAEVVGSRNLMWRSIYFRQHVSVRKGL